MEHNTIPAERMMSREWKQEMQCITTQLGQFQKVGDLRLFKSLNADQSEIVRNFVYIYNTQERITLVVDCALPHYSIFCIPEY